MLEYMVAGAIIGALAIWLGDLALNDSEPDGWDEFCNQVWMAICGAILGLVAGGLVYAFS
jgi:hypothetical protein